MTGIKCVQQSPTYLSPWVMSSRPPALVCLSLYIGRWFGQDAIPDCLAATGHRTLWIARFRRIPGYADELPATDASVGIDA
jgi:hypothetical protein